ncbi:MAG: hypothetical protein KDE53_04475, partial [Caldilineaceae bacterium]|nr:hypothetical protein [Caldilineaceae bacterium]
MMVPFKDDEGVSHGERAQTAAFNQYWTLAFFRQHTSDDRRRTTVHDSCDTRIRHCPVIIHEGTR